MIGVLAAVAAPELFRALVLVGPSPRYVNDGDYVGGFERADIDALLDSLESNYLGWSAELAPAIMGRPDRPELGQELTASFCRTDPRIARQFARVTFLSDNRADLAKVPVPTLVLQCAQDIIAPAPVGEYVRDKLPDGRLVQLNATGHCPNLSAPEETAAAIAGFLRDLEAG
jgi:sigma-B regulation protein RsbQ